MAERDANHLNLHPVGVLELEIVVRQAVFQHVWVFNLPAVLYAVLRRELIPDLNVLSYQGPGSINGKLSSYRTTSPPLLPPPPPPLNLRSTWYMGSVTKPAL